MEKLTVKEIAEKTGLSRSWIYAVSKKLGRLPTIEEIETRKGNIGRPKKYFEEEGE